MRTAKRVCYRSRLSIHITVSYCVQNAQLACTHTHYVPNHNDTRNRDTDDTLASFLAPVAGTGRLAPSTVQCHTFLVPDFHWRQSQAPDKTCSIHSMPPSSFTLLNSSFKFFSTILRLLQPLQHHLPQNRNPCFFLFFFLPV